MTLKNKKKVYLSLNSELLDFVENKAIKENTTKSKLIFSFIKKEFEEERKRKIAEVIEGKKDL